jgi:hypothetical protein
MYINLNTLYKSGIDPRNLTLLLTINNNSKEDMSDFIAQSIVSDESFELLKSGGWITTVKSKKKSDTIFSTLRLSKKGRELLKNLDEADVDDASLKLRDWVVILYQEREKTTKNKKRLAWQLSQFASITEISHNKLAKLIQEFVDDEDNMHYNHISNYMFEDPKNVFFKGFRKEDSRLWHYYNKRINYFTKVFERL